MRSAIEAAGFTAFATSEPRSEMPNRVALRQGDPEREERALREKFAGRSAQLHATAIFDLARDWVADVIVRDEVDFGAAIAAERMGIPCGTVLVLAAGGFLRRETVAEPLHELRAQYGLPPDPHLNMLDRRLVLSPFPPSFRDPHFPLPASTFSFRQQEATSTTVTTSQSPTVYFTLGTEFNMESGDLFSRVLGGLRELPVQVVMTVGRHIDPAEFGPQPDHVRIERFVPQTQLLPQCDLVISHGGSGSVIGALSHGLPAVLFPMGADQPHNARRCADLGTARILEPVTATPEIIGSAVSAVLEDQRYRDAAKRIQIEINALPGPENTVPLLEKLS